MCLCYVCVPVETSVNESNKITQYSGTTPMPPPQFSSYGGSTLTAACGAGVENKLFMGK